MTMKIIRKITTNYKVTICFIVIFAFLLRWIVFSMEPILTRDAIKYLELAQQLNIDKSEFIEFFVTNPEYRFTPLYIFFISWLHIISGLSIEFVAVWANIILGSLLVLLSYNICNKLKLEQYESLSVGFLVAVHPTLVELSFSPQREIGYLFFILLCLYFVLIGWNSLYYHSLYLAGGAFAGIALLFRYEAIEVIFMCILGVIIFGRKKRKISYLCSTCTCYLIGVIVSILLIAYIMGYQQYIFHRINSYYLYRIGKVNVSLVSNLNSFTNSESQNR